MPFIVDQKIRLTLDVPVTGFDKDWTKIEPGNIAEAHNIIKKEAIGTISEVSSGGWYRVLFQLQDTNLIYHSVGALIHETQMKHIETSLEIKKQAVREVYVATIQIAIEVEAHQAPEDFISELLGDVNGLVDWGYLMVGGQYMYPTARYIPQDYEEGELFN